MKAERALLLVQVTLQDTVSEMLYTPLALALLGLILALFGVIPLPMPIFGSAATLLALLLAARVFRNLLFIRRSDPVIGEIGQELGKFRKWTEHWVHFEIDGRVFRVKHAFLRKEVAEGEPILLLTHARKRQSILVVRRMQEKDSLVD